jgi:hypothetical protein
MWAWLVLDVGLGCAVMLMYIQTALFREMQNTMSRQTRERGPKSEFIWIDSDALSDRFVILILLRPEKRHTAI